MPSLLHETPAMPISPAPPRKRWTREQLSAAEASGVFEGESVELIDGELISKMGKNRRHVIAVSKMFIWLVKVLGEEFVDAEAPIDLHAADNPTNEPQPDVIVLARDREAYIPGNPQPRDLRLVVEVSDSSLAFDLTVKAALYARARIAEYWVLDVTARRVIVHREPEAGTYRSVVVYGEDEGVAALAAPASEFRWTAVIGGR